MRQQSFAADDFEKYRKKTRKEIFLEEMDRIIPWTALSKVIRPYYPKRDKDNARDPDMHQTRKGNQWYFGMKTHIGVDNRTKLIHSVAVMAANVHDSQLFGELLHGDETHVWGDSAYTGQKKTVA